MSCNYAEGLSPYENKGKCGLPEKFDSLETVQKKVSELATMIQKAGHVVFHTGAGVSTSAGIPDFRGPKGVWTLEKKGLKPEINVSWDDAKPTTTHLALASLQEAGYVQYVITQNIDGLHLKSGLPRLKMSELHGNMFVHQCNFCKRQFVRKSAVTTVGEKCLNLPCPGTGKAGRGCRGKLHDIILDWEGSLPQKDLELAEMHSEVADLSVCLGTTLQILPSGNLPTWTKKHGGKLVICNLQPTKHDKKGDLIINTYVDDVMTQLCKRLGVEIKEYDEAQDPTKCTGSGDQIIEWTIPQTSFKDAVLLEKVKKVKVKVKDTKLSAKRSEETNSPSSKKLKTQSPGGNDNGSSPSKSGTHSVCGSQEQAAVTIGTGASGGGADGCQSDQAPGDGLVPPAPSSEAAEDAEQDQGHSGLAAVPDGKPSDGGEQQYSSSVVKLNTS
ncbi:NAD-dependent protein deacetylase Sirt6-like [Amphibalanus amphitrite]|uniref:NAD-dependent protein deacetylase Sirt6-like n=1 Tax=Amphibalanus amphitrite TaxID=1232801 RepID=UPI001C91AA6F|nr:NAD-dependent protein deacetylase Sirt6-like [Amphibalanus amphitrite]